MIAGMEATIEDWRGLGSMYRGTDPCQGYLAKIGC